MIVAICFKLLSCAKGCLLNFNQVYIYVCCKIAARKWGLNGLDSWFYFQKGGVGKSTKARALAREASACGIKTKLADLDLEQLMLSGIVDVCQRVCLRLLQLRYFQQQGRR